MLIFQNSLIYAPLLSYLVTQALKVAIYSYKDGRFDYKRFFSSGGMPSSHAATVSALALAAWRQLGPLSPVTALALVVALIVMYDARGVRQEAGKHAKILNELSENLWGADAESRNKKLNETVGHTLLQVLVGGMIGALIAFLVPLN